jgi:hypothetical protein
MSIVSPGQATLVAFTVALTLAGPAVAARTRAAPHSGPPPFCISRGGGEGASGTYTDCRYYDYQSCLQAAAGGGNCVRNIATQ